MEIADEGADGDGDGDAEQYRNKIPTPIAFNAGPEAGMRSPRRKFRLQGGYAKMLQGLGPSGAGGKSSASCSVDERPLDKGRTNGSGDHARKG